MVGGGSPNALKRLQQEIISDSTVSYFNSNDHDNSLTYIAAGKAVVLSPGFLNDHNPQFVWIPFDTDITFQCVLCTHNSDNRKPVRELVRKMIDYYRNHDLML